MHSQEALIESMIQKGVLRTPRIIETFRQVDRALFVPPELRAYTYEDRPLPIGEGQTISQPSTVAFMLELLQPKEGEEILDIGSGSGWTTALLCSIVGKSGKVIGLERIDELVRFGKDNFGKLFGNRDNCSIEKAGEFLGIPGKQFDAILVSAAADHLPVELIEQLKVGGRLVVPVNNSIYLIEKLDNNKIKKQEFFGFSFVPLIVK